MASFNENQGCASNIMKAQDSKTETEQKLINQQEKLKEQIDNRFLGLGLQVLPSVDCRRPMFFSSSSSSSSSSLQVKKVSPNFTSQQFQAEYQNSCLDEASV